MAKVTGGLFGLGAKGTVGKCITYATIRGVQYVKKWFMPKIGDDPKQVNIREAMRLSVLEWTGNTITAGQKTAYGVGAEGQIYNGFALYIKRMLDAYILDPGNTVVPTAVTNTGNYPDEVIEWNPA